MADDQKDSETTQQFLNSSHANWGVGIAIGLGFGLSLGAALGNIGIGIALGAAFAVVYALMMGDMKKRHDEDQDLVSPRTPRE